MIVQKARTIKGNPIAIIGDFDWIQETKTTFCMLEKDGVKTKRNFNNATIKVTCGVYK